MVGRAFVLWLRLLRASLMAQMSYRHSFVLEVAGRFAITLLELVAVLVMFDHIDALAGWSKWEVAYLYGVASCALGLAEFLTDGLNDMPELVRRGTLDALLVRPVSPLVQVMGRHFRPFHTGRILQGALTITLSLVQLGWIATPVGVAGLVVNLGATAAVFVALFVAAAATLIYAVESAEVFSAFTYGGVQMAQFPLTVYPAWLQWLFLFLIPVGYAAFLPAQVVLGRPDDLGMGPIAPWLAPVVAALALGVAGWWWRHALNHYRGTGS